MKTASGLEACPEATSRKAAFLGAAVGKLCQIP